MNLVGAITPGVRVSLVGDYGPCVVLDIPQGLWYQRGDSSSHGEKAGHRHIERMRPRLAEDRMANQDGELTLEGLARVLRDHMDASAAEFAEMRAQFATQFLQVGRRIDDLRGEIGIVAGLVRDLAQIVARHDDEINEHRRQIRESNARIEEMTRDIRRILDAIERRGGNGGSRGPG